MSTARDLTSRMIIGNLDIPLIVVMAPNPQSFEVGKQKVFTESQTLSGWVNEHWGNKQDTIACSGITSSKVGRPTSELFGPKPLKDASDQFAEVDMQLLKLEQIYQLDKERFMSILKAFDPSQSGILSLTGGVDNFKQKITGRKVQSLQSLSQTFIIYRFTIYLGYFTDFKWRERAEAPRVYSYDFNFKVTFRSTDFFTNSLLNNFPEARAAILFKQIKDITAVAGVAAQAGFKSLKSAFF